MLVEADLHQTYGIDISDEVLMRSRSWRWLQVRILGLLSGDVKSRLRGKLYPSKEQPAK